MLCSNLKVSDQERMHSITSNLITSDTGNQNQEIQAAIDIVEQERIQIEQEAFKDSS
jgi:hypothetical protein